MCIYTVKKIPEKSWSNDKDMFYAPTAELPAEFVTDCVVWAAFSAKNNCTALKGVKYQGDVWQIPNQMFPFLLEEVRRWPCGHGDIAAQLAAANEDRFLAKWLAGHDIGIGNNLNNGKNNFEFDPGATAPGDKAAAPVGAAEKEKVVFTSCSSCFQTNLSPEARAVLTAARALYREFYANICHTPWMDWKIETWDVGYYQVRNAMKGLLSLRGDSEVRSFGEDSKNPPNLQVSKTPSSESKEASVPLCLCDRNNPATALREAHDALRAKLLPQIYSLGFLNPDVEYFS